MTDRNPDRPGESFTEGYVWGIADTIGAHFAMMPDKKFGPEHVEDMRRMIAGTIDVLAEEDDIRERVTTRLRTKWTWPL